MYERIHRSVNRFIRKWEAIQVELHGHYSIERFAAMNEYNRSTSSWRALSMLLFAPLPSLILVALIDAMPLEAPEQGLTQSGVSWARGTLTCFIYTHCVVEQIRLYSPNFKLGPLAGVCISLPTAIFTNALAFGLAALICWPLPFASILMSGPWLGFMTFFLLRGRGAHLRANPEAVKDVMRFATISGAQIVMVLIYAAFNIIFTNLSPTYQPLFALLIPAFKVLQKNVLSRILAGRDDTKPQVVILNVEIFNALFIASCMQNSQSISTSITLITVDLLQAAISLLDLCRMMNGEQKSLDKLGVRSNALISTAELVLENYPNRRTTTVTSESQPRVARISLKKKQVLPTMNMECGEYEIPIPRSHPLSVRDVSRVSSIQSGSTTDKGVEVASARPTTSLNRVSSQAHYRLLKKALQVLFLTEFMLLIEFTEVLVPVIYGGYLVILYHFPNRRFYPQLSTLSDEELWNKVTSVLEYGVLELVSLVLLILVLNRLVHGYSLKQLAFVFEREFLLVQPKLILWVTMTMQSTLPQLGVDYSFKFAWIRNSSNSTVPEG
ncbi:hypothetical protein PHYPSEUDO_007028 [Phytophthora pseudosyringae]|uniref:Transmembrane protein n=1 Tax=Phytophthora pseudosyringae TaxID=221518 RepID=A0A8T1VK81_9STRA|nr:hypothetical protein PHYPSEUDO_007028 [Phytophthora pseudosyringae]